jgi:hypothetical protein
MTDHVPTVEGAREKMVNLPEDMQQHRERRDTQREETQREQISRHKGEPPAGSFERPVHVRCTRGHGLTYVLCTVCVDSSFNSNRKFTHTQTVHT